MVLAPITDVILAPSHPEGQLCNGLVACTEVRSHVTERSERDIAVARRCGSPRGRTRPRMT